MLGPRRKTRQLQLGNVAIGGGAPVSVQSMLTTSPSAIDASCAQISDLAACGCEIVRVAVPDEAAARALATLVRHSTLPLVADIHFRGRLALLALEAGVHGLRLNPGTIDSAAMVREIAGAAKNANVPIRVGVNGGSIEKELLQRFGGAGAEALVESALGQCRLLEKCGFTLIKVSLKSSSVATTVAACRMFAARSDYPLHLGLTEAGPPPEGIIKNTAAIAALLLDGIGDTIRVSLTAPPVEEVRAGIEILEALGLRPGCPEIISCPTCGRCQMDLTAVVMAVKHQLQQLREAGMQLQPAKVAIMGCAVNGPGEAREADLGIAGGSGNEAIVFADGNILRRVPYDQVVAVLISEIIQRFGRSPQSSESPS